MNWLRNKLRAWLQVPIEVPTGGYPPITIDKRVLAAAKEQTNPNDTARQMYRKAGEGWLIDRKLKAPELPPHVRGDFKYSEAIDEVTKLGEPMVAFDSAENAPSRAYLSAQNCGTGFPGYGYLSELSLRSEYRAPVETTASEATREWIKFTVEGDQNKKDKETAEDAEPEDNEGDAQKDKIEKLEAWMKKYQIRDVFRRLCEIDGFFGRAQLFIDVGSSNSIDRDVNNALPLVVDPETIPVGSFQACKAVEPIWTTPYNYNSIDPTAADFYKPRAWFCNGKRIHSSRLLTFVSREVADILKPAYNFGGISMSQLMESYVFQWLRTRNSVSNLIHSFSIVVLKTDMSAVLQGGSTVGDKGIGIIERMKLFVLNRDNQGILLTDKNREELEILNASLANLDKLQAQSQEHMAAPSHIPLVKLTGITPAGLNADSEGEIQVWYDFIRAYQEFFMGKHLTHVIRIAQCDLFGEIDESIGFEWVPLSSPTTKELSEIRKADADTDVAYITNGVVSPEEARSRVAADPMSGYTNLSGPAPEPPEQLGAEHGAGLEEEAKDADHERGEEAAKAGHKRALELEKTKAKLKPKPKPGKK